MQNVKTLHKGIAVILMLVLCVCMMPVNANAASLTERALFPFEGNTVMEEKDASPKTRAISQAGITYLEAYPACSLGYYADYGFTAQSGPTNHLNINIPQQYRDFFGPINPSVYDSWYMFTTFNTPPNILAVRLYVNGVFFDSYSSSGNQAYTISKVVPIAANGYSQIMLTGVLGGGDTPPALVGKETVIGYASVNALA